MQSLTTKLEGLDTKELCEFWSEHGGKVTHGFLQWLSENSVSNGQLAVLGARLVALREGLGGCWLVGICSDSQYWSLALIMPQLHDNFETVATE